MVLGVALWLLPSLFYLRAYAESLYACTQKNIVWEGSDRGIFPEECGVHCTVLVPGRSRGLAPRFCTRGLGTGTLPLTCPFADVHPIPKS